MGLYLRPLRSTTLTEQDQLLGRSLKGKGVRQGFGGGGIIQKAVEPLITGGYDDIGRHLSLLHLFNYQGRQQGEHHLMVAG